MNLISKCVTRIMIMRLRSRRYSKKAVETKISTAENGELSRIRNIGILAHIDAGKTTTTERMLFYSGRIEHMGEVHHGNTVTDFMEQERQRGITITSASVTFQWGKHIINLLDTPGHVDFTMEVEQTLNVMDGAIVILDGSAGVEAQTVTVWRQADRYKIPRIIYVNKMDKPGADLNRSINSIGKHLQVVPVLLHIPVFKESKFKGIVDVLSLEKYEWNEKNLGTTFSQKSLSSEDGKLWEDSVKARVKLTEVLADLDDKLAEEIILDEKKIETISNASLKDSIKRITLNRKGVAALCGSSYKNIGVQLLMDAVIDYLPSPLGSQSYEIMECFKNNLCARAFKVKHDHYKGPITFFRIYSGSLSKGAKIYNIKQEKAEQCGKLYVAHADDYEEVVEIKTGNIAAVTGLKFTATGELVTSSASAFQSALKATKGKEKLLSIGFVPDPVFFCSVEAPSDKVQGALEKALSQLAREDPSLKVTVNKETGQTVLGGMGELHLEIIKERIKSEYKVDATLGPLEIAYKEALITNAKGSHQVLRNIGSFAHSVDVTMSVVVVADGEKSGNLLLDKSPDCIDNTSAISPKHLIAVKKGIESALESGPKLLCPVVNVNVMLHSLEVNRGTSDSIITSATSQCVNKLLKTGETRLLEPIMLVEVACAENSMETVLNDLGRRRGKIESSEARPCNVVVRALVPLSELLGYSRDLRIMTSGSANFTMEFHSYGEMNSEDEAKAIKSVFGVHY